MGRPSKRTAERETVLLQALRAGMTRTAACKTAGLDVNTLADWIKGNAEFSGAVTKAEADAVLFALGRINKSAREAEVVETFDRQGNLIRRVTKYDWRAAAWWLEHSPGTRAEWGSTSKVELSGPDGGPIESAAVLTWHPDEKWLSEFARVAREATPAGDDGAVGAADHADDTD